MTADNTILDVRDLVVEFQSGKKTATVLNGVNLSLRKGETLCVVGESGCGKSITSLAILGLIPSPPGKIASGQILYESEDLVTANKRRLREVRGNNISMIFQEPMTSLNPVYTVGEQIAEALRLHKNMSRTQATEHAVEMLKRVGIPAPEKRVHNYPHQLSGGMRQRVMIAMALACEPDILIADEPTTALDVTVQAQIFDLLRELQRDKNTAIMLITHDMGAVAEMADRVIVMYAGRVIEEGPVQAVLHQALHPYTQGLIACLPELGSSLHERQTLAEIPGMVPSIWELGQGCAFRSRCAHARAQCEDHIPPLIPLNDPSHKVACWLWTETAQAEPQASLS